jgi:CheY-like chemotaxis protein
MVEQLIDSFRYRAEEKRIEVRYQVADDVPDRLVADPLRLRQVLMNLISNAVKFTERGGVTLAVTLDDGEPGAPATGGGNRVRLRFSVADTGIGISPQDQERIFAPFTQVDPSSTRRHGGTGLGLSIASDLVRAMGDRLAVRSEPGVGSEFHFTLALERAAPLPVSGEPGAPATGVTAFASSPVAHAPGSLRNEGSLPAAPLQVLLAEDVPTNQKLVVHFLKRRGHAVDVASNGAEAIDMARRGKYDVILMDVQMPEVDGLQAAATIRTLPGLAAVPIIALTAHAMQGDRERCLAAGMDDYLPKPLDMHRLVALVESAPHLRKVGEAG